MRATILPNGNMEIRISEEEQRQLCEDRANAADPDSGVNWESDQTMRAILEPLITNDEYEWIEPECIGALTSAPILATLGPEGDPTPNGEAFDAPILAAWWYEPYQVRAPQDDLADTGRCTFWKVPFEEETDATSEGLPEEQPAD